MNQGSQHADNEFRQPMPMSNRFGVGSQNRGSARELNEVSITSEDKTYLANIPINIPPEEHL